MQVIKVLREKIPKSPLLYGLVCVFGIGSWIAINGIWAEISILVSTTPECDKLPAALVVVIQVANLGPLLYTFLKYCFYRYKISSLVRLEIWTTLILIATGICACTLLSFFWNRTLTVKNNVYSMALYILSFLLALVDCTSSVVFIPFMKHFPSGYLSALYIGEGLSGLLPSLFALTQGSVNNTISCNGNYTGHEALGIRFSPNVFFIFLGGMMVLCGMSFTAIITVPSIRKYVKTNDELGVSPSSNVQGQHATHRDNSDTGQLVVGSKDQQESHIEARFSIPYVCTIMWSNATLFVCLALLNFLINGALNSISPYAFLRYGNGVYHTAINLALLANPLMSFIFALFPSKSKVITAVTTVLVIVMGIYVIVMAQSPAPNFQAHLISKIVIVSATIPV